MQTRKRENYFNEVADRSIILNAKVRDSSSKIIFDDSVLCAQFMKDYVDILKDVEIEPEQIEDVSNRYVPLIAEERNCDTVKKVSIPNKLPFYFISLIEHKTQVDYNVGMQMFRYIYQIWEDYEKEMETKHKGISKTKDFQYPPVIPIVYYEGDNKWTAPMEFKEKIAMQEIFGNMIPNFTYQLVCLKEFTNQELLDKGDAISLMMLINKIQDRDSINQFMKDADERILDIVKTLPYHLVKKIADILRTCLYTLNVQEEEVEQIVSRVEERKMGRLFENVTLDIQAERRELEADRKELEADRNELEADRNELEAKRKELEVDREKLEAAKQELEADRQHMIQAYIETALSDGKTTEQILDKLQTIFMLDVETAKVKFGL